MPTINPFAFKPDAEAALDDVQRFRSWVQERLGQGARLTGQVASPLYQGLLEAGEFTAGGLIESAEFLIPGPPVLFPTDEAELARRRQTQDTLLGRIPGVGRFIESGIDEYRARRSRVPGAKLALEFLTTGGEAGAARAAPSLLSRAAPRVAGVLEGRVAGRVLGPGLLGAGLGSMVPAETEQERLRNIGLGFAAGLGAPEALRLVPFARPLHPGAGRTPRMSLASCTSHRRC